jgi:hypothetical protein
MYLTCSLPVFPAFARSVIPLLHPAPRLLCLLVLFTMFTFSKASPKAQPQPHIRFRTFNGWTSTIEGMRAFATPAKPRKAMSWLRRGNIIQRVKPTFKQRTPHPSFPLMPVPPISPHPAEVEATAPLYGVGHKDYPAFEDFCCTKVVLVASTEASRPCRIRRINTRKELPWIPVSKPLPPLPTSPAIADNKIQPVTDASRPRRLSTRPSSPSSYSYPITSRNSLDDTFDDGLDDLSLFLRRIAYDVISASTIHRHLGFMEDGGRVLTLGRTMRSVRRGVGPPKRYSSLMGLSLAIMEGRLPKALMVM